MAGEIVKGVAVELMSRGTSFLINTYNHKCRTNIEEKLHRVEMLVLKLQSISEESESYPVAGHEKLCRWKEKFDEAARQGDDIIRLFKERADREKNTEDSHQADYSIASVPINTAKRLKRWFSGDDDVSKLNDTLKRLESVNDEVPDFLELVKMNRPKLVSSRSRESSAIIRRAKRTTSVRGQVYLQAKTTKPVLPRQIANWARMMIAAAARLLCGWFSSKFSNDREIIRVEQLITMINYRIRDVGQERNDRSLVLADWLKKVREVASEGEIELCFLKSRENGLKDRSGQRTVCLGSLLGRLEKAAKDTEDILEALMV